MQIQRIDATGRQASTAADDGDPFSDPVLRAIAWLVALVVVLFLVALAAGYWSVEYAQPSWNTRSVPPPLVH